MCKILPTLLKIRKNLSDDLLKPEFREIKNRKPTTGHCYVAAEAMYHLLSKKQKTLYKPHRLKINGTTHWYLMYKGQSGVTTILDATYDQFNFMPKYEKGIGCGFLTKQPSKRTSILLNRIKNGSRLRPKNA